MIRPTAALYWIPLALEECLVAPDRFTFVVGEAAPVAFAALALSAALDRLASGRWYLAAWNFARFNLLEGGSEAYGAHPWHWYLTQGVPAVALAFLPLAARGCRGCRAAPAAVDENDAECPEECPTNKKVRSYGAAARLLRDENDARWEPAKVALWTIFGHSLVAHKEFRFLMPALPPTLAAAGAGLAGLRARTNPERPFAAARVDAPSRRGGTDKGEPLPTKKTPPAPLFLGLSFTGWIVAILATQAPAAAYLSGVHQRGTVVLMRAVAASAARGEVHSGGVLVATPCHQTPWHSHVHRPGLRMRFLTCEPPEVGSNPAGAAEAKEGASDEADRFAADPGGFLRDAFGAGPEPEPGSGGGGRGESSRESSVPSHVAMFDGAFGAPGVEAWLDAWGFRKALDEHHAHFAVDRERQARILMFARPRPERRKRGEGGEASGVARGEASGEARGEARGVASGEAAGGGGAPADEL